MVLFTTEEADAYDHAHNRDIAAGKAKPIDYTKCLCGYSTHAVPKQNGNSWICSDPACTRRSRFEEVKR